MMNKINKERLRLMNASLNDLATRTRDKEPCKTPNKNRTGRKAEHGQANHTKVSVIIYRSEKY
jgi:hypothetical protein